MSVLHEDRKSEKQSSNFNYFSTSKEKREQIVHLLTNTLKYTFSVITSQQHCGETSRACASCNDIRVGKVREKSRRSYFLVILCILFARAVESSQDLPFAKTKHRTIKALQFARA